MVQAAITAERIIVSFDFFRLMAPARTDRHNYMDVATQWLQGVHGKNSITQQRVIQLHHSIIKISAAACKEGIKILARRRLIIENFSPNRLTFS